MTRLTYPDVPLHALMQASARRHPNRTALRFADRTVTFAQFDEESNRLARGLRAIGLMQGDRLGLFLPNCPECEFGFYAASKLGAIATPLNPSYTAREIAYQLNDAGATVLLTHERLWPVVEAARQQLSTIKSIVVVGSPPNDAPADVQSYAQVTSSHPAGPLETHVHPDELVALPYSSGTTGMPKGVMLTHRNLVCNHIQFSTAAGLGPDDTYLVYLPLSHIYGVALMGLALHSGATQIVLERFDLDTVTKLIATEGVTILYVVPPVLLALANASHLTREGFRTLRYMLSAAAPLAPDVARRVEQRFGVPVIQAYGMTEASPDTHHSPLERERIRLESVGVPVADTEQRVVDVAESGQVLGPGEIGEIVVRGPQVMRGYWNAPEETGRALQDGWLHTGDIGYIDADGYLYIVDRKKEMIKYKSFSIAPADLEAVLVQHPDVADCAVIGVPDAECGELPKAFVVPRSGATIDAAALDRFVADRVAGYKRIRFFETVKAIPRTPSGKILRRVLKQTATST
jgi:long-chain acyl-CoA synthetase